MVAAPSRPPTPRITCDPDAIPALMRPAARWGTWDPVYDPKKPAKPKKLPFQAEPGDPPPARSNDPITWSSFDAAVTAWRANRHAGLAFFLGGGWAGVDLDGCRDPETGVIAAWAQVIIDSLGSYAEVSPSGTGVKLILLAEVPRAMKLALGDHVSIEVYGVGRYFAMTGAHLDGTPAEPQNAQGAIDALIATHRPAELAPAPLAVPAPAPAAPVPADGWRVVRAVAVDRGWRAWVDRKVEQATARMRAAAPGQLHHSRVREARLLGGVIAVAPGHLSAQQAVDALFRARLPESHSATEHKAIVDGLELGLRDPIPPQDGPTLPTDESPRLDASGRACCPTCDTPLRRSQFDYPGAGPGWFCPRCKFPMIWPADAAKAPSAESRAAAAAAAGDDSVIPDHGPTHRTDLGNAARMVRDHGAVVRWVGAWGRWVAWDGTRWLRDETGAVDRLARETVRGIYAEAAEEEDEAERKALAKWAANSESRGRLDAMIVLARHEPGIPLETHVLNADPWLLNAMNGTIDLKTGDLRPHRRDDKITKCASVAYDPAATCPRWLAFLDRIFLGDVEVIRFVQLAVGYTITGMTTEACLFFLYGGGKNGKSTFVNTLMLLLGGDYAQKAPPEMLMAKGKGDSGPRNDLAALPGVRMSVGAEIDEGRRLAESVVKDLTGDDPIRARFLHQEFFTFVPTHKLWMYGNHKPTIRGTDDGIWRRIRLIPFLARIPKEEQVKGLADILAAEEGPGILAWAVRGCLAWQREGLEPPAAVVAATAGYRNEMDVIGSFFDEAAVLSPAASAPAGDIYAAYVRWCEDGGEFNMSQRRFGVKLTERGLERYKSNGVWRYRGIGLLSDRGDPAPAEESAPPPVASQRTVGAKPTAAELMQSRRAAATHHRPEDND